MDKKFDMEKELRDHLEIMSPSPDFTKKVMGAIDGVPIAPVSRKYINKKIIYGIVLLFLVPMAACLAYVLATADWSQTGGSTAFPFTLTQLQLRQYLDSNGFYFLLILNVLLLLALADKYFHKRLRAF